MEQDQSSHNVTEPPSTAAKSHTAALTEGPQQRLKPRIELNFEVAVSSSAYLTDDSLIALGMENGSVNVIATNKGSTQYILKSSDKSSVSSIALNPDQQHLKNAILLTHVNGTLQYWHATSKQLLFSKKYEEFLYACEISCDGSRYAFAGDKGHLMLSNMNKGAPVNLDEGHLGAHGNRVFCIKWSKSDPNCFISGGWDKTVFFWDVRSKTAAEKVYGCFIGGESIDSVEDQVLLGNNLNEFQLRIYDRKISRMRSIDWVHYDQEAVHCNTGVLSCSFSREDNNTILAQSARNELRVFNGGRCHTLYQEQSDVKGFSYAHALKQNQVVTSWNNGDVKIIPY